MRQLKNTLLFPALLFSISVFSQQGVVMSAIGKLPIEGATVNFKPDNLSVTSDELGRFLFLKKLPDSIIISAIGFETKNISYQDFLKNNDTIFLLRRPVELSSITVSANRPDQFSYISKVDVKMRDVTNSQEVLRLVPGLFIGQHAGGGKAEQLFLRGFDIDHGTDINIAVDGMPVNMVSHAHGQGYADLHFLIPELIENIHFRKGDYDAEKGNLATAGHVEFKTKNFLPANSIKLEAGQFNSYRGVGMFRILEREKQSAFIASEYMFTNGYFEHDQDFHRLNLFGKFRREIGKRSDLVFSASTFSSKWKASGQIPERALHNGLIGFFGAIDPNEGGNTGRSNLNAEFKTTLNNGDLLKSQAYFTRYDFELYSDFTFFLNDSINGDQVRQKEKRNLLGYNGSYIHRGNGKFSTEFGVNLRFDKTRDSELSRTKNRVITTDRIKLGDVKEFNQGLWVTETIKWNKKFTITAGLRFDHFSNYYLDKLDQDRLNKISESIISPKLKFYYQLNKKTQFYFTAGKGFHSNDVRVAIQTAGKNILPAAYGADLGMVCKPSKNLLIQSALWYLKLQQEFVYVGDEGVIEPSGRSRRLGVDLSLRYQPVTWLYFDVDANYSLGRAIDEKNGEDYLPLAPVLTSIGGIGYKNKNGLSAGLRYRYMADRPANETNSIVAKGYFVTDAVFNYASKKFEAGISIQNLFNIRWKETQFDTESRLKNETESVSEIHFTPGTPFFLKGHISFFF
jgi:hypothetical protein